MLQDFLQNNLKLLSARHQGTFGFISKFLKAYKESDYIVAEARNGDVTLSVSDVSCKIHSYHSKYNPTRESEQVVSSSYKGESHAVLLGMGMGYLAEQLLCKLPDKGYGLQLFIVEPDPYVFITALKFRDLSKVIADERVTFYVGGDVDSVGESWNDSMDWSVVDGLAILEHAPSKIRFNEFFNKLLAKMKYLANRSRGNMITLMNVGSEFHTNNFLNLPEAFGLPGAERLFDKFINVPVIVVAAGPSLDKNLEQLRKIKGRFPIIAVDTAYRHMLANGIKPDIVCAADSSYENSLDFVGVEDEKEVILMAELMTHPDIFKVFKGPKMITTFGGGLYPQVSKFREPFGKLICWGSVATMAFDLARCMGANPIIFVGFDLSFKDGRIHTRGSFTEDILYEGLHPFTSMENATAEYICERGKFQFKGADGDFIYTDTNMKAYRDWFEDQFQHTEAEVINATEGGIVEKHVTKMPLLEAINKYFDKGTDVGHILSQQLTMPVKADYDALYDSFLARQVLINGFAEKVRKIWPVHKELSEKIAGMTVDEAKRSDTGKLEGVMGLHDGICENVEIVQWFAALNTKFVAKHTSDVVNLRNQQNVKVGQWLELVGRLFATYEEFAGYQLPLLSKALLELRKKCVKIKVDK